MKKSIKSAIALVMSISMLASASAVAVSADETAATVNANASTATMYNAAISAAAEELGCEADAATVIDAIVALDDAALADFDDAMVEAVNGEIVTAAADAVVAAAKAAAAEEGISAVALVDDFTASMEYAALADALDAVSDKIDEINKEILALADNYVVVVYTAESNLPEVTPELVVSEGSAAVVAAFEEALAVAPESGVATATLAGDIIVDSKVAATDLVAVKKIVIGKAVATTAVGAANADLNEDGKITVLDVVAVKDILLN